MTKTFEIAGHHYKTRNMEMFDQMVVAKRLMPVLKNIVTPELMAVIAAGQTVPQPAADSTKEEVGRLKPGKGAKASAPAAPPSAALTTILPAIADAIYSLSDEDAKTIISKCLACIDRRNAGGAYSPLMAANGGGLLFQDVNVVHALQISWQVIEAHLGDFFSIAQ